MYVMQPRNPQKNSNNHVDLLPSPSHLGRDSTVKPGQEHRCALTGAMVVAHRGKVSWIHGAMRAGWTLVISGVSATV